MKTTTLLFSALLLAAEVYPCTVSTFTSPDTVAEATPSQWKGKKVAFLGDSITDPRNKGTNKHYWKYLSEMLGITPFVYGISGRQWNDIDRQAEKLKQEHGDEVDAIIIFVGTNDFNHGIPLGEWYTYDNQEVQVRGGGTKLLRKRLPDTNDATLRGRINRAMEYLKTNFPRQQIIVMTPLHRAQARFSQENIQPEESYPNALGLYIDSYVEAIKETANVWAVPVIDLNSLSGLYPLNDQHARYFANEETDRLHPNAEGHLRMAKTLYYQLLALPSDFK